MAVAADVIAHVVQRCKNGDYSAVANAIQRYDEKLASAEERLTNCATARFEANSLQRLLANERSKNAELTRMYEVLLFRTKFNLVGPLTEDRVMDDSEVPVDRQTRIIYDSFGIPETPPIVERESFVVQEAYLSAVESQAAALRSIALMHMKPALLAQITERLVLKRAMVAAFDAERERESVVFALRRELQTQKDAEELRLSALTVELAEARRRIAAFDSLLSSEISRAAEVSVQREKDLEAYIVQLQAEVAELRPLRGLLNESQQCLEKSTGDFSSLQEKLELERAEAQRRVMEAKRGALSAIRRISTSVGMEMVPALSKEAVRCESGVGFSVQGSPSAVLRKARKSDKKVVPSTPDLASSQSTVASEEISEAELDAAIRHDLEDLEAAVSHAKELASAAVMPQLPPRLAATVKQSSSVAKSIASSKLKVAKLLERLDPELLDPDVMEAVKECMDLEAKTSEVNESIREELGLSQSHEQELPSDGPPEEMDGSVSARSEAALSSRTAHSGPPQTPPQLQQSASSCEVGQIEACEETVLAQSSRQEQEQDTSGSAEAPSGLGKEDHCPELEVEPVNSSAHPSFCKQASSGSSCALTMITEALVQRANPEAGSELRALEAVRLQNLSRCALLLEKAQDRFARDHRQLLPPLDSIVVPAAAVHWPPRAVGGAVKGKLLKSLAGPHEFRRKQAKAPNLVVKPSKSNR